jgi:hypothetical protein
MPFFKENRFVQFQSYQSQEDDIEINMQNSQTIHAAAPKAVR